MYMDTDMEIPQREIEAQVEVTRVDNGYKVSCWKMTKEKRTIRTMLGEVKTNSRKSDLVFSNLADVVKFLGDHYKEPTVGL